MNKIIGSKGKEIIKYNYLNCWLWKEVPNQILIDLGFNENDFGILLGAGYSITDNININADLASFLDI